MKVTIIDTKTGREKSMDARYAKVLTRVGRATYMTRDMVAVSAASTPSSATTPAPDAPRYTIKVEESDVVLDNLDSAALHELAKKLHVKVHHASGAEKVRLALIESQSATKE